MGRVDEEHIPRTEGLEAGERDVLQPSLDELHCVEIARPHQGTQQLGIGLDEGAAHPPIQESLVRIQRNARRESGADFDQL